LASFAKIFKTAMQHGKIIMQEISKHRNSNNKHLSQEIHNKINAQEARLSPRDRTRAVSAKTVLNVAQMFVELHLISPATGE